MKKELEEKLGRERKKEREKDEGEKDGKKLKGRDVPERMKSACVEQV